MIQKSLKFSIKGTLKGAFRYLFQEKDNKGVVRPVVQLLSGSPDLLLEIEKNMTVQHTYYHSILAFTAEDMVSATPAQRADILENYVNFLAAGLPSSDRLPFMAVDHGDHIHVIVLRCDLESGKTYQPMIKKRGDIHRLNTWTRCVNDEYKMSDPNAPERARDIDMGSARLPPSAKGKREALALNVQNLVKVGRISSRSQVVGFLNSIPGVKVSREVEKSVSIEVEGHVDKNGRPLPIRFKGAVFERSFVSLAAKRGNAESTAFTTEEAAEAKVKLQHILAGYRQKGIEKYGVGYPVTEPTIDFKPVSSTTNKKDNKTGKKDKAHNERKAKREVTMRAENQRMILVLGRLEDSGTITASQQSKLYIIRALDQAEQNDRKAAEGNRTVAESASRNRRVTDKALRKLEYSERSSVTEQQCYFERISEITRKFIEIVLRRIGRKGLEPK